MRNVGDSVDYRIVLWGISPGYSLSNDATGERAVRRTNLFELLGRPVAAVASDRGTLVTAMPTETHDDAGLLPSIADCGTLHTRSAVETYDDDSVLPSVADFGTYISRADWETYDDDSVLPLM